MIILYTRVSTVLQNTDRQIVNSVAHDLCIEDRTSGKVPLFEREGGAKLKSLIEQGKVKMIVVHQTDRLGRDLLDILQTIQFCNAHKVCIHFQQQNLRTLNEDGGEDTIAKLVISMLATFADIERKISRERIAEGIALAKAKKKFRGRVQGTKEMTLDFLSKPKYKKALELLKKGYKGKEIAKLENISVNTVTKLKKLSKI